MTFHSDPTLIKMKLTRKICVDSATPNVFEIHIWFGHVKGDLRIMYSLYSV
jgi:hypothetical protein